MENQIATLSLSDDPSKLLSENEIPKLGTQPLAAKKARNVEKGTKVLIDTNIRKLTIKPNTPIFKYAVQVMFVFVKADGTESSIEVSKSAKRGTEHENDKSRCQRVYNEAVKRYKELQKGGPYFYDRQASLYTLTRLKDEDISFEVVDGICKRQNFKKAVFSLKKVNESFQSTSNDVIKTTNSCPAFADKTLLEAMNIIVSGPAYENENVITVGSCVHYLIDPTGIDVPYKEYSEGMLYSGVGASKSVKTLEGTDKKSPSLFMTTEMKTTLFHPDYVPLIDLIKSFKGFAVNLKPNAPTALRIQKAFVGLEVILNYGSNENLQEDGVVMKIRGFHTSAMETFFEVNKDAKEKKSVFKYFKEKYGITLQYPQLFTIEAKGKHGKVHLPVELLLLAPSQTVTNDQMINNEQADMIRMSAAQPHIRKTTTDTIVKSVGLASNNIYDFIKVQEPIKVDGVVLPKPNIEFSEKILADLNNTRVKFPTDFNRAGRYYEAKNLSNWEIAFIRNEEVKDLAENLVKEMRNNGMKVTSPQISFFSRGDLDSVFAKAKSAKREIIFFVIKSHYNYHQQIKALEQKYDVLSQEIRAETAEKVSRQAQTRLNIINKTNMKLGGLNYQIRSETFNEPGKLIIGFETSQRSGGNPDHPISVGYAANMLNHYQKFAGGYVYVKRSNDIYGPIISDTFIKILETAKKNGRKINDVVLYFNGVSEGQFSLINEVYLNKIKQAFATLKKKDVVSCEPQLTIIASSKTHNERLYKTDKGRISNLEPGTVIDHTIVSNVYNEWYLVSAVARQGTAKATKFTLIYTSKTGANAEPMWKLEQMTNDLCYDHQIVFHPVSLPVPLFIAGRYSQRGAMIMAANNGPIFADHMLDIASTNAKYGCYEKHLFASRYNA